MEYSPILSNNFLSQGIFPRRCTVTSSYQILPGKTSKDAPRQHESDEEIDSPTQDQSSGNMFGFMLL